MTAGSVDVAARVALVSALSTGLGSGVAVAYSAPADVSDLVGASGLMDAVWTETEGADLSIPVLGPRPGWYDETVRLRVVCQALRSDGSTQIEVDSRASELLAAVIGVLAGDPLAGVSDTSTAQMQWVEVASWSKVEGIVGDNRGQRGARYEVTVRAHARQRLGA